MDMEVYKTMCYSLAKAYTTGVRLYQDEMPLYYYSPYDIEPDPLSPFLHQIINCGHEIGIISTLLCQFYGFLTLKPGLLLIIGPTCALNNDKKILDGLLELLQIEPKERKKYIDWLYSAPIIHVDRLAWLLISLETVLLGQEYTVEDVWIEQLPENNQCSVQMEYTGNYMNNMVDMGISQAVKQSISWEQLVTSYVEEGNARRLRELFSAPPKVYMGENENDGMRQRKNRSIGMVTSAARAAIRGGMDPQQSFLMADIYIQKLESVKEASAMEEFTEDMLLDFAEQVERLRCPSGKRSSFCRMCIQYVSQNIFTPIRVEDMAKELGYSRSYLCSHFKEKMGLSLTQYINQEKIEEAKRLLQFSDCGLSEIAGLLHFSSQSHFQVIFKKVTGMTPLSYRKKRKLLK